MAIDQNKINELLSLCKKKFPDWDDFSHPGFTKEEVDYKRDSIKKAKELISKEALYQLIKENNFDEFISRLKKIAKDNNLLWISIPRQGDLNILHQEKLNKPIFCEAIFDLLYGEGESIQRLENYLNYIKKNNLPNKWTFPTYFLFILNPDKEYFIKPETTKWFLEFINREDEWSQIPDANSYKAIRNSVHELKQSLDKYQPKDIVDIQGFIYVCFDQSKSTLIPKEKRDEILSLFSEFITEFSKSPEASAHIKKLKESRVTGNKNYEEVVNASNKGEDITDLILLKLLPYSESESNREASAWISIAPAISGNIKKKYEKVGFTKPNDWPYISKSILQFIKRCLDNSDKLKEACTEFSNLPHSKGFQAGILSPILNALNPDEFKLVNRKPIAVINFLLGTSFSQSLEEYPSVNGKIKQLVEDLSPEMRQFDVPEMRDDDLFDMFGHWLNAIKKFKFKEIQYWKIAPGENAWNWKNCHENGFIAIGWDQLGDISKMNKSEFEAHRDGLAKELPGWTKVGVNQVWEFARHIREGDRIIANKGTTQVVGIGTVIGSYNFVSSETHGHRLPVEWEDITPRKINEGGWRRTLIKLDQKKYEEVIIAPAIEIEQIPEVEEEPTISYGSFFSPKTFELLEELHHNPTLDFYSSHREDFKQYVENPMRDLLKLVARDLPDSITEIMETKSKIFSRIPKNDFGRGGAWDYYWGAFYPKGGKRIEDAQLSIWINRERFEYGFYIGKYGSEQRKKFLKNCKENFEILESTLKDCLDDKYIFYGLREELAITQEQKTIERSSVKWNEWLKNPEVAGIDASVVLPKEDILKLSKKDLKNQIAEYFTKLFPLALLSTSENPIAAINDYLEQIDDVFEKQPVYSIPELSKDTGFTQTELERWIRAIERKGQAIFYGPPGTGKTFIAMLLAKHLIGGGNGFLHIVQFHPAFAYEDFIQGIRPQARPDGSLDYKMIRGRFLDFCNEARKRTGRCALVIDEINRANLARVFGELMYLLEYRKEEVPLAGGNRLNIPQNIRIIGTMNTADRSIALVDHALRRRFAFFSLYPNYDILREFHKDTDFPIKSLIEILEKLNVEIDDKHYHIGITFFLNTKLKDNIEDIWKMEIEPYLEEYFYDQPEKAKEFNWVRIKDRL